MKRLKNKIPHSSDLHLNNFASLCLNLPKEPALHFEMDFYPSTIKLRGDNQFLLVLSSLHSLIKASSDCISR